jgi:O-antigen/teichoic acid export membrane protein
VKRSQPGRKLLGGTLRSVAAELLFPITALVTTAVLTRHLGPAGYGLLALAATVVSWIEWGINSLFARTTIKFVGEHERWEPLANHLVRQQAIASLGAALLLWLFAVPLAALLEEPMLAPLLALFALNIPLFNLVHAHKNILLGRGRFAQAATLSAVRWVARLIFIVVLVEAGLSVEGAILGTIAASIVELVVARRYVRPSVFGAREVRPIWGFGLPLFVSALSLTLFAKTDLFALKALGGSTHEAGWYGAAQNLSLLPSVFAISFIPALLSTLSRLLSRHELDLAKEIGRNAMRVVIGLLPLAAIVAGAAGEIVTTFFGPAFEPAAALLAQLAVGSFALVMVQVAGAIFTAAGLPARSLLLTVPLLLLAVAGHLLFIPRYGPIGAARVTTGIALTGALWAVWNVNRLWRIVPPPGTLVRAAVISAVAYTVVTLWATPGWWVFVKLVVTTGLSGALYVLLAEFNAAERAFARSFVWRRVAGGEELGM